jgi:HEAT repeat protein
MNDRKNVARVLGRIGDIQAVEPLIAALRNADFLDERESVTAALGKIDPNWSRSEAAKRQIPEFIAALGHRDISSIEALVEIGDASCVEPLIAALKRTFFLLARV